MSAGKVMAIGHAEHPESIYNNPRLYPQMFPWLFPYGLGGLSNTNGWKRLPESLHKRQLLMYYDKRFQMDQYFPIIAFNQEQIKSSTTGGFLLADKNSFEDVTERLLSINTTTLSTLAARLAKGENVTPSNKYEEDCFQLLKDLDHIGGHVEGSLTSKKYMRNEIWSLIAYKGAPSWFITFAPADVQHPIALYYASTGQTFQPDLLPKDERIKLIATNPVAGARFFDMMVKLFIRHVLGVHSDHDGLYGETSAYYGTVEQQAPKKYGTKCWIQTLNSDKE
ncbi:hypothetical protein OE88DRAFT_1711380 [Heliocybe sulcata]|uniref:Helitron helicase-like domain-containing protein n=1 Tax=Heliocybe sulcata TaxID=5364 RepID=A0A5C3NBE5_9AGAM|nr:hypothetical protein OE88DRAFT_1711380 [Heliocybe sulcata]